MSQPPHQPYPGAPEHQPGSGAPWSGQPAPAQPAPGQPLPGQSLPGQPSSGVPASGQPYYGPAAPGQPQSGPPYQGQPHPERPSTAPPQPGFPPQPSYDHQPTFIHQPGYGHPVSGQPQYGQPRYGQPVSGQPSYGQPVSGQPGYPQPGPNQPGYPQPGHPQAGHPQAGYPQADYSPSGPPTGGYSGPPTGGYSGPPTGGYTLPPKPKSRALPITLVSIAVVLVLCVGGSTVVYLIGRNTARGLSGTQASTEPTPDRTTAPPASTITVVEPKTLGGRPKLTDPEFAAAAEQLERNLARVPNTTQAVGGLYGEVEKRDIVIAVAATAPVRDPAGELESLFEGASGSGVTLTGLTTAYPGPLGGVGKCGKSTVSGTPLIMCGWADSGSVGWVMWYFTSMSKAKAEFPQLRGEIEKKSN